jgi:hypothetical protein
MFEALCFLPFMNKKEEIVMSSAHFGDAMMRVFPSWPRDQFGRMTVDQGTLQALRTHALRVAGVSSTANFFRVPKGDANKMRHGAIRVKLQSCQFLYPSCRMHGLRELEREMAIANQQLTQTRDSDSRVQRVWRKGQWVCVDEDELQSMYAAEGKLSGAPRQLWLPPKAVPLVHCACATGPAVLHRWDTTVDLVHASQMDRALLPNGLRWTNPYFAVSGRPIPIPLTTTNDEGGTAAEDDVLVANSVGELQLLQRQRRSDSLVPPLCACWFEVSELASLRLQIQPGRKTYSIACEEHHICLPLTGPSSIIDAEVRDSFLAAFPPPPNLTNSGDDMLCVFCGVTKEWFLYRLEDSVEAFGVQSRIAGVGPRMMVDVASAEELGLVRWEDDAIRRREWFFLPPLEAADATPSLLDNSSDDAADADGPLDTFSSPCDLEEAELPATDARWGANRRRRDVKAAIANALTLSADVLRDLANVTMAPISCDQAPPTPGTAVPLAIAEDTAGVTIITARRHVKMVNASDVMRT